MRKDDRETIFAPTPHMIEMNIDILNTGLELWKSVKLRFGPAPIVPVQPIVTEFGKVSRIGALFPPAVVFRRAADFGEFKLRPYGVELSLRDIDFERCKGHIRFLPCTDMDRT